MSATGHATSYPLLTAVEMVFARVARLSILALKTVLKAHMKLK